MAPLRGRRFGLIYHDGYEYVVSKTTPTTRYMKCYLFRHYCRATAKLRLGGNVDKITVSEQPHNHPRSDIGKDIDQFRRALKQAILVEKGTYRAIYDRVAIQHPNAADHDPFKKSLLSRWRLQAHRNQPQDFEEQIQSYQIYNTISKKLVPTRLKFGAAIYHDGYEYVISKSTPVIRYLKCRQFRSFCRAYARLPVGADVGQIKVSKKPHNHPRSDLNRNIDQFKQALKQVCLVQEGTIRSIYELVAKLHSYAASYYPFKRARTQMLHWRAQNRQNLLADIKIPSQHTPICLNLSDDIVDPIDSNPISPTISVDIDDLIRYNLTSLNLPEIFMDQLQTNSTSPNIAEDIEDPIQRSHISPNLPVEIEDPIHSKATSQSIAEDIKDVTQLNPTNPNNTIFNKILDTRKKFGGIYHDGYEYIASKKTPTMRYFRCSQYRDNCRATAKLRVGGDIDNMNISKRPHNHPRSDLGRDINQFRQALKRAIITEVGTMKSIYEQIATQYPNAAFYYSFKRVHSQMKRWRSETRLNISENIKDAIVGNSTSPNLSENIEDRIQPNPAEVKDAIIKKPPTMKATRRRFGVIYHDGYEYVSSGKSTKMRYLRCSKYQHNCRAGAKIPVGCDVDEITVSEKPHNHPRSDSGRDIDQFRRALKQAMLVEKGTTEAIYKRVAIHHPNARFVYPFKRVRSQMIQWRAESRESQSISVKPNLTNQNLLEGIEDSIQPNPTLRKDTFSKKSLNMEVTRKRFGIIYHDGYEFITSSTSPTMRYLKCSQQRDYCCKATAKLPFGSDEDKITFSKEPHNHPRSDVGKNVNEFRQALKRATLLEEGKVKDIYERVAIHHTSGAVYYPFKTARSQMTIWLAKRHQNLPEDIGDPIQSNPTVNLPVDPIESKAASRNLGQDIEDPIQCNPSSQNHPEDIEDSIESSPSSCNLEDIEDAVLSKPDSPYLEDIEDMFNALRGNRYPRYSQCSSGNFVLGMVEHRQQKAFIFGCAEFIRKFEHNCDTMFVDTAFRVVRRQTKFAQLLMIFGTSYGHGFPIFHVFMESKNSALYKAVFELIKTRFPNLQPRHAVSNFELGLMQTLQECFPNTKLHGCYFKYCQAIHIKARILGLLQALKGNQQGCKVLQGYCTLPLLPSNEVVNGMKILEQQHNDALFTALHYYMNREWIEKVTPARFTVFNEHHRTTNVMKAYQKKLKNIRVEEPCVWDLINTLVNIQDNAIIEQEQLERGHCVYRLPCKSQRLYNERLTKAWKNLSNGYTVKEFMKQAVKFVEKDNAQLTYIKRGDNAIEMEEHAENTKDGNHFPTKTCPLASIQIPPLTLLSNPHKSARKKPPSVLLPPPLVSFQHQVTTNQRPVSPVPVKIWSRMEPPPLVCFQPQKNTNGGLPSLAPVKTLPPLLTPPPLVPFQRDIGGPPPLVPLTLNHQPRRQVCSNLNKPKELPLPPLVPLSCQK